MSITRLIRRRVSAAASILGHGATLEVQDHGVNLDREQIAEHLVSPVLGPQRGQCTPPVEFVDEYPVKMLLYPSADLFIMVHLPNQVYVVFIQGGGYRIVRKHLVHPVVKRLPGPDQDGVAVNGVMEHGGHEKGFLPWGL